MFILPASMHERRGGFLREQGGVLRDEGGERDFDSCCLMGLCGADEVDDMLGCTLSFKQHALQYSIRVVPFRFLLRRR